MYQGHKVIDGHMHYDLNTPPEFFAEFMDRTGTDQANVLLIYHREKIDCLPDGMVLKAMYPQRFFVYGSPHPLDYLQDEATLGERLVQCAKTLMECGCDGIKIVEGKPQCKKLLHCPDFDLPCWEPFWAYAEEQQIPILLHVNDPMNFWDSENVPVWAKSVGWFYDETYVNNEDQYAQVERVFQRHPRLRVVLAHFYFMSGQLQRLGGILERFPGVNIDLTPGIEMYEDFSANREETAAFFERWHDRILYGTDIAGRCTESRHDRFDEIENLRRPRIVRHYLTTSEDTLIQSDGHYLIDRPDFIMRGLGLTGERLDEILSLNFIRFNGSDTPKPVNGPAVLAECQRLRKEVEEYAKAHPDFEVDYSGLDRAEDYFRSR